MNQTTYARPGTVTAIAAMTLLSGILNVFWGATAGISMAGSIFLLCVVPVFVAQFALGVYEIVYASKLLSTPPQPVQPATTIAVLEIGTILVLNVFSMVVGILSLVFYNDPQTKTYFALLNTSQPTEAAAANAAQATEVDPSVLPETSASSEAGPSKARRRTKTEKAA